MFVLSYYTFHVIDCLLMNDEMKCYSDWDVRDSSILEDAVTWQTRRTLTSVTNHNLHTYNTSAIVEMNYKQLPIYLLLAILPAQSAIT